MEKAPTHSEARKTNFQHFRGESSCERTQRYFFQRTANPTAQGHHNSNGWSAGVSTPSALLLCCCCLVSESHRQQQCFVLYDTAVKHSGSRGGGCGRVILGQFLCFVPLVESGICLLVDVDTLSTIYDVRHPLLLPPGYLTQELISRP